MVSEAAPGRKNRSLPFVRPVVGPPKTWCNFVRQPFRVNFGSFNKLVVSVSLGALGFSNQGKSVKDPQKCSCQIELLRGVTETISLIRWQIARPDRAVSARAAYPSETEQFFGSHVFWGGGPKI